MVIEFKLLFEALDASSSDSQFSEEIWQKIIFLYRMGGEIQADLIARLAQYSHLQFTELSISPELTLNENNQQLCKEILQSIVHHCAENKKIEFFQQNAYRLFPNINMLNLSREEWLQAINLFNKQEHERFTIPTLLTIFSRVKKIDEGSLVVILSKEQATRPGKPMLKLSSYSHFNSYKRQRRELEGENPLIFASNSEADNTHLNSPLRQTGVRIIPMPSPTTAEDGYPELFLTPNKTQKVRPVLKNRLGTLFKPKTPLGNKSQKGMVDTSNKSMRHKPTKLQFEPKPQPIRFTVTLEKIQQRQGVKRRTNQYQLTGARCIEVFKMLGCEELITVTGHDYHWSHLVAYFLGGEHNKENLAPTTAAANYNTLELVELRIAAKLANESNDGVSSIDIVVSPYYSEANASLIPDLLLFRLTWQSPKDSETHFEEISINPRSYQRVTSSMHKSIAKLRTMDEQSEEGQLEKDTSNDVSISRTF